ncbi:protein NLRC5-like [Dysidea avara]|uniref:protein NLRC5-like n=1 Tax=Dysidea avara TaxID=196820 RepID=UPI00332EA616
MHVASEAKPRLKDLHNLITPLHAVRWREIGNHLGLQSGLLEIINYDQQHKAEDCCNMVWEHWLDMDSNACWKKVLDAIDVILLPKRTLESNAAYKHDISPETTNIVQHLYKKDRYKTTEDDWPPYQPEHYASVALIHHKDKLATTKTVISVGIKMYGGEIASQNTFSAKQPQVASKQGASDSNDYFKICHTTKDISEIFTPHSGEAPNMILIEGAPGIGKTILSKEIAFRWANGELLIHKKVLVLMLLRDPNIQKISSFSDLAKFIACSHAHNQMVDSLTNYFENSAGEDMTIIFDGYDELPKELRQHSFVADLINRKYLPLCGLVITSRPTASAHLHKIVERRIEILGFAEEDRKDYIYHSLQDNQADIEKVLKYLENNPFINSLCYIPLNMTILICLFKEFIEVDGSGLPKNQTEMNNQFACMTVSRCIRKEGGSILSTDSLSRLPQPYKKQILQLSKLAFMFLRIDKIVFSLSDIKSECPKLLSAVENFNALGLLKAVQYFSTAKNGEETSFNFLHFSLQEFLAAYYIGSSSNSMQVHMLEEYFWDNAITSTILAASQVHISLFAFGVSDAVGINFMNKLKCTNNLAQNCIGNSGILSNIDFTVISSTMLLCQRDTQDDFIVSGQKACMSNQAFTSSYLAALMQEESLKHLETIDISGCNITDEWFKAFCYTIVSNRLKKLDLSSNNLTNVSTSSIIKLLRSCIVEMLIISYNFIKDEQLCFVIYLHILEGVLQLKNFAVSCPLVIINSKENLTNENHDMMSSSLNYAYAFFIGYKFNENVEHIFKTIVESQAELYRLIHMDNNLQLKDVDMLLSIFNKWSPLEVYIIEYGMKEDTASRLAKEIQKFLGDTDQVDKITKKIMYILHSKTQLLSNDAPTSLIVSALTSNSSIITLQASSKSKRKVQVKRILPIILSSSKKWNMIDFSFCNIEERDFQVLSVICREYVQTKESYVNMKRSMQVAQVNTLNLSHNNTSTSAFMYISQIASILRVQNMMISVKTPIPITTLCLKFLITAQSRDETELTNLHMVNGNDILVASCDSCNADMIYQKLASATARTNCSVNSWKLSRAKSLEDQKFVTPVSLVNNNFDAHTLLHYIMVFSSPTVDMFVQEQKFKHENQIIDLKFQYSIKSCDEEFSTRQYSTVEKSLHSIMFQLPNSNRKQINTFTGNMPMELILNLAEDKSISTQLRQFVISNTDISNKLACEIAKIISDNPKVEYIELSNNNLQEDGFMKIAKSFKVLKHLQSLNLNYNKISANVVEILSYIIENTKLCQLDMSHCSLGDHEMLTIVKSLDNTNTISLAKIDFCSSIITDVAACFLSSALSNSPSLTHLNLSGCNLQEQSTEVILFALKLGSSIKKLDLNFNMISHNAASQIAQFKNVVEHLGLSNCKLQYSELYILAKAFDGTLKSLSYNYNCISDVIAKATSSSACTVGDFVENGEFKGWGVLSDGTVLLLPIIVIKHGTEHCPAAN